jgi:hypothetical protein
VTNFDERALVVQGGARLELARYRSSDEEHFRWKSARDLNERGAPPVLGRARADELRVRAARTRISSSAGWRELGRVAQDCGDDQRGVAAAFRRRRLDNR